MKRKFDKILVANRGEIAVRIMRSAQELGIKVVAIYEETDKDAYHIMRADEAVCVGPGPRKDYLNIGKIIEAARQTGAQAIHPGYGFLAENPDFPEACTEAGLVFIGPPPEVIRNLGSKVIARKIALETGIPVIPATANLAQGTMGERQALDFAAQYGYPVMIKAVSGGGGRGIRQVDDEKELLAGLQRSRSEALMSFGDDNIYLEKHVKRPRHVEVQILADTYGNVVHLGTRNCSIQRRHQKLIEIAPGGLEPALTAEICAAAVRAARAANYLSAGTVEFLVDPDGAFFFLEVNTRLQVEHTVTEVLTGIDIVREQLLIAMGEPVSFTQDQVVERGYAIELRINAEDPKNNFLGQPRGASGLPVLRRPRGAAGRGHLPGLRNHSLLRLHDGEAHGLRLHLAGGGGPHGPGPQGLPHHRGEDHHSLLSTNRHRAGFHRHEAGYVLYRRAPSPPGLSGGGTGGGQDRPPHRRDQRL